MSERRKIKRTKLQKAAKIFFGGCETLVGCVVCDLSTRGAGITIVNTHKIPDVFDLTFDVARTLRPCRVVWRSDGRMGVEFLLGSPCVAPGTNQAAPC
jgi:hypothetical protein